MQGREPLLNEPAFYKWGQLPAASSCANSWTHQSAGFVAGDRLTLRTNLSMIMFTVRRTLQQIDREIDR